MTPDSRDLPRIRALLALSKFSAAVQSDVLADGTIAARFDLPVTQPVQLLDQVTVNRTLLFDAFQKATDGQPLPALVDNDGKPLDISITMEADAAVIVRGSKRSVFPFAALMSSDPETRVAILTKALAHHSLARDERARLEVVLRRPSYSDRDFMAAIKLLTASPESFMSGLRDKASSGRFSIGDLLPEPVEYWNNLTAPFGGSATLQDFIASELAEERLAALRENPERALGMISLTFGSPGLIPRELLKDMAPEVLLGAVERISKVDDPFALCGVLDLCAERAPTDSRFAPVGAKILQKLLGDMKRLDVACDIFGAVFVITTAYLAEHQTLRQRPAYWRRLAAASHAALVLRTLGAGSAESEPLLAWAYRLRGSAYYLSVFNEFRDQPRWRPDWIEPRFLVADIYGRAEGSYRRFPEVGAPTDWHEPIQNARASIEQQKLQLAAYFPAVLEGGRRPRISTLDEVRQLAGDDVAVLYRRLIEQPSVDNFILLTPVVHTFGLPAEVGEAVLKLITSVRTVSGTIARDVFRAVLSLAAHVAAETMDLPLADLVADTSIENAVDHDERKLFIETVFTLLESAAANANREEARVTLACRLESLAFLIHPSGLINLLSLLKTLQSLDTALAPHLGRAIAIARLGRPSVAA